MEIDSRASSARTHTLPDGARIRLRAARTRDEEALRALLRRCAPGHGGLDAARLARYDPRREVVICATEIVDSSPALVGVGAVDLDGAEPPEVVVDKSQDGELTELLYGALDGRVSARRQR